LVDADEFRSLKHDEAAAVLVESGVVPTEFLGRIVVRAYLVDIGDDRIDSARQADFFRRVRAVTGNEAAYRELLREHRRLTAHNRFPPEEAKRIQKKFLGTSPRAKTVEIKTYMDIRNKF
jgi:hypothetical protein